ncbi:hypothetical protein HDU97_005311 [Phlyctochytrium planicorne]|nr:hypothetical protein HDU97_005311 [Phlyctochytrium planicorne]
MNVTTVGDYNVSVFGYVGINHRREHTIVAFRGSRNMDNWLDDLLVARADCPYPGAPEVREEVLNQVTIFNQLYPLYEVWFTGHSLGGALATLAAVDLRQTLQEALPAFRIKLLTFGQPRVGNSIWADWVDSLSFDLSMRVVNQDDFTPHLPPSFSGFKHCPDEIWIADDNGTTLLCSDDNGDFADILSNGAFSRTLDENKDCANRVKWKYNISRHTWAWGLQLVGVFFVDASLGTYQLFPFLIPAFSDPSLLKSKITASVRLDILNVHKAIFTVPTWAPSAIIVAYALLLITALLNMAVDSKGRFIHLVTGLVSLAPIYPFLRTLSGPAVQLAGKKRLAATSEAAALYDIGLTVGVSLASFGFALVLNLLETSNDSDVTVKEKKTTKVKKTE